MRFSRRDVLRLGVGAAALGATGSPLRTAAASRFNTPVADHPSDVATAWFRLSLDLVEQTAGFTPPVVSRAFGYMGVALYETLQAGMPDNPSLDGRLNDYHSPYVFRPRDIHWEAAANRAMATMIRRLFPTASTANLARVDQLEDELFNSFAQTHSSGRLRRSAVAGQSVAEHVFEWSVSDGGHEGYLNNYPGSYVPPLGPGLWIPTPPGFQPALQPYWQTNRPFVLNRSGQFDPGSPPQFSTNVNSAFYAEAFEVYDAVNSLTDEQLDIALFWSDDPGTTPTPPGHSISILTQILELLGSDLAVAAEAYLKTGVAISDAFITCWYSKYRYNLIRPISYIQAYIDASWGNPLPVITPPFPEYTSGHSVQTAAFAQVAHDIFGPVSFTDHTHDARGLAPRSFTSWFEMANETAISRLYGGIHYRAAIERGIEQGRAVGSLVSRAIGPDSSGSPGR